MRRVLVLSAAGLALAAAWLGPAHAAAPNDDFAAAQTLAAVPVSASASTSSATTQAGEPQPCPVAVGRTVWYAFTAPASGTFIIDTYGSDFDTILSAFTGSAITSLNLIECNDDSLSRYQSRLELQASAGVTYRLQAGGYNGASGNMRLNIAPAPPAPVNDSFGEPVEVAALPFAHLALNYAATLQGGESRTSCSESENTVWYRFVPPETGDYQIDTMGSDYDTVLAVYTGTSLSGLTEIGCNDDVSSVYVETSRLVLPLTAGIEYRIQAGGFSAKMFGFGTDYGRLALSVARPVAGDTDADGCSDNEEGGGDAWLGGSRSIYDRWDVFDVTGDGAVDLSDTVLIIQHFGHEPGTDPIDALLDRYLPDPAAPHRSSAATAPNMGIDVSDALVALASFGLRCGGDCPDYDRDTVCDATDQDDDNDGCLDAAEAGLNPSSGGRRNALDPWDFFDVTKDRRIDLSDALAVLARFGLRPGDAGYDESFDRYSPVAAEPWRTAHAIDGSGIDLSDALVNLDSFGHDCR